MENITNIIERNLWLISAAASWLALSLLTLTILVQVAMKVGV